MYIDNYSEEQLNLYIRQMRSGEKKTVFFGAGFMGSGYIYREFSKKGIVPSFYVDSNHAIWDQEIVDGIYCRSFSELVKIKDNAICVVTAAVRFYNEISKILDEIGIDDYLPYYIVQERLNARSEYFPFMKDDRIAVYTCIINHYDDLREPLGISDNCDYYLISDEPPEKNSVFEWIDIKEVVPNEVKDFTRMNRYCKINAHKIFPQYRRSIYFDGLFQLKKGIEQFFDNLKTTRIAACTRDMWNNVYEESIVTIERRADDPNIIYNQMKQYWLEGFTGDSGGVLCGILLREHNNPICVKLMKDWWIEVQTKSRRDMLSFPYVIWKNGFSMNDVFTLPGNFLSSPYFNYIPHHNASSIRGLEEFGELTQNKPILPRTKW